MGIVFRRFAQRYARFFGDVGTLATGRAVVVIVKIALLPVIARLFLPEHFGIVSIVLGIASIAGAIATLRYERAIVLPDANEEAGRLAALTLRLLGASTVLLAIGVLLAVTIPLPPGPHSRAGGWLFMLPLSVALTGVVQVMEAWATRVSQFRPIALGEIGQTATTSVTRIAFGALSGSSIGGLFLSYALGMCAKIAVLSRGAAGVMRASRHADRAALRATAKAYRDFPLHNAPTALVRDFSNQLPTFALAYLYSPAMAGFFAMANRLVWPVVNTGSVAIRRVFIQRLAAYHNAGRPMLRPALLTTAGMAAIGVAPFGILWLAGEPLIAWLLGDTWRTAGRFVALLAPWFFFGWITTPAGALLVVLRKQAIGLRIHLVTAAARAGAFVHTWTAGLPAETALIEYAIASIAGNLAIAIAALWLLRHDGGAKSRSGP